MLFYVFLCGVKSLYAVRRVQAPRGFTSPGFDRLSATLQPGIAVDLGLMTIFGTNAELVGFALIRYFLRFRHFRSPRTSKTSTGGLVRNLGASFQSLRETRKV